MHGIHFDHTKLDRLLFDFMGGQFQIQIGDPKSPDFDVYRGEVISCITKKKDIPGSSFLKERSVRVRLAWLCKRLIVSGPYTEKQTKWQLLPRPPADHYIEFIYNTYYEQEDENRLKVDGAEIVAHFYHNDDHTNIVWDGAEFVPYYTRERGRALKSVMLALLFPKKHLIKSPSKRNH